MARVHARVSTSVATLLTLATDVDTRAAGLTEDERRLYAYQRATLDYGIRAHALLADWIDEVGEVEA